MIHKDNLKYIMYLIVSALIFSSILVSSLPVYILLAYVCVCAHVCIYIKI